MEKNMKNVLITGGLGHIGSKLIRELTNNYNVTVVDDFHTQRYCSLFDLAKPINFIESSFVDTPEDAIKKADVIIHLAAITNASKSFGNKDLEDVMCDFVRFGQNYVPRGNGTFDHIPSTIANNSGWSSGWEQRQGKQPERGVHLEEFMV